jgi:hypothetical protein
MPALAPVAVLWVAGGLANTLGTVAYETLLQEKTEDSIRGRVMAVLEASLQAGLLIGVGMAALTDTLFKGGDPARMGMLVAGVAFGVAALASWWLLQRKGAPAAAPLTVRRVELVPIGASVMLVRVTVASAAGPSPALLVDDGVQEHRLQPLPAGSAHVNGTQSLGYGVPGRLLARGHSSMALDAGNGRRLAVTLPAL